MRTRKLLRRKGTRQVIRNQHLRDYLASERLKKEASREAQSRRDPDAGAAAGVPHPRPEATGAASDTAS
jgi:hypothetical protein